LSLAKDFAIRKRKDIVVNTKALDPLGLMTRSGDIARVGAFVFSDTPLRTLMNEVLDCEAVKALLDIREVCALPARYHQAILPAGHARLFSANSGVDNGGNVDHGAYFAAYGQPALANMARKDLARVLAMSDDERATCRRVIIFTPTVQEIGLHTIALETAATAAYADELLVQEAYYAAA
jgi:hypothetical protein